MGVANNVIKDISTNNFPVLQHGSITQFGISPLSHENYSYYFPKNSTPLSISTSSLLNFRGNDFTLEMWVNFDDANQIDFSTGDTPGFCLLNSYNEFNSQIFTLIVKKIKANNFNTQQTHIILKYNNNTVLQGSVPELYLQKWVHLALTRRDNTQFLLHINGKFITQTTLSVDINNPNSLVIGGYSKTNEFINNPDIPVNFYGYIADFRISSIGRYNNINFSLPNSKHNTDQYTKFLCFRTFNLINEGNNITVVVKQ
jgi:hypothetical protein